MTVALVMLARDEEATIQQAIRSAESVADDVFVLDTGSVDKTVPLARAAGAHVGLAEWEGFAASRARAVEFARQAREEPPTWLLMMDADMTVDAHPGFREWLDRWPDHETGDPDPSVDAWNLWVEDRGWRWRLPWLLRGDRPWTFQGETHALPAGGKRRDLNGLTLHHHGTYSRPGKYENDLVVLADGVEKGDPRSVYYSAWALRALGRRDEAASMFDRRAAMEGTWEEERWHAQYMAAWLREDVAGLLEAYRRRPWRHEPLSQAARLVAARGAKDDILFLEDHDG